jgi:hypothetical protein
MNDDLDARLREDLLQPPTDFTQRVMSKLAAQIQPLPRPALQVAPQPAPRVTQFPAWPRLRWLAARAGWLGGGLLGFVLGLDQLAAFVFGLWMAGAAL